MRKFSFFILGFFTVFAVNSQITVKNIDSGIALDGHLEEGCWDISVPVAISFGSTDNTANFGLLWDNDFLYIGVEVEDNILCNGRRQAFYDDGVEICVDGDHEQSVTFDENDLQMIKPVKSFWVQEMNLNFDGILHDYMETDNGYTMEIAVPWNLINTSASAGKLVGFNIVVNDDDDASNIYNLPGQLIWEGNSNYYQSPQNWGTIELSDETVTIGQNYLALTSAIDGDFLISGHTASIEWFSYNISDIKIDYSTDNGSSWITIIPSTPASAGSFGWTVDATASDEVLIRISDASNAAITDQSDYPSIVSETLDPVEPLIDAEWQNYQWPYNAYFPLEPNGINGHLGNGCGPSSLARILHSWEFPRQGNGSLSFTDYNGYFWSADFGNTIYNFDNMPDYLPENAPEPEYADVATLFLHAQVAMNDYYGTGTDLPNMAFAMQEYFNYQQSDIAYMHNYTPAEWTQLLIDELNNGRSLLIQGMNLEYFNNWHTSNSIGGHWYHCDGYNQNGEFHIVVGFGNYQYDGYYSIEEFPLFGYNLGILTGLEPDMEGKTISLLQPNGGETYIAGDVVDILWESSGISNLQIEFTLDNGQNWTEISPSVNAGNQSFSWSTPETNADQCKIRLTDTENINVYDKSDAVFTLQSMHLSLSAPSGGENFVFENVALIKWEPTPVQEIDLYSSFDNGNSWNEIATNYNTSYMMFEWIVPSNETSEAWIKIVDSEDETNFDICDAMFGIVPENVIGGPYIIDNNTILLLNGEGNFYNQSDYSDDAVPMNGTVSFTENSVSDLGKAIFLDNTNGMPYLNVQHNNNLSLSEDWTIELWFKPVDYNEGLQYFLWKPGDDDEYFSNYSLQLNGYWDDELFAYYFSGEDRYGVYTQFYPFLNEWYHVAFIRNTANSTLGLVVHDDQREEVYSSFIPDEGGNPLINSQDLKIGFNFNGYIDEIRISNIPRTFTSTNVVNNDLLCDFNVYPNPSSDFFYLDIQQTSYLQVFSRGGTCVIAREISERNEKIDVSGLSSGLYLLVLMTEQGVFSRKIVIQH